MVPLSDGLSRTSSKDSYQEKQRVRPEGRTPRSTPKPVNKPPVTVDTLQSLLDELRFNITADIGQFHEKIKGLSARLHNTEQNTATHETRIAALEQQLDS
ncbi:Hypothetical predicted protein [Pelobates cultripes]|uniref:Uncharacterized protein n=1 Tax=Pelobates cultripes TaxID=61616 RepID=A0AAD1ST95_PELCU|nr:Hypothetical predicted protein [Pelobates cultripes]